MGAKVRGAVQIIGVDTNSEKFEKGIALIGFFHIFFVFWLLKKCLLLVVLNDAARSLGVTKCVNPTEIDEPIQQVFTCLCI